MPPKETTHKKTPLKDKTGNKKSRRPKDPLENTKMGPPTHGDQRRGWGENTCTGGPITSQAPPEQNDQGGGWTRVGETEGGTNEEKK